MTKPDLTKLKASEKEILDKVIEQMSDWSAATIDSFLLSFVQGLNHSIVAKYFAIDSKKLLGKESILTFY